MLVPLWGHQLSAEGAQDFVVAGFSVRFGTYVRVCVLVCVLVSVLTALLKVFWERYHKLAPWQRVYYEMIQVDALIKPFTDYDADPTEMNRQVRVSDHLEVRTHYNI